MSEIITPKELASDYNIIDLLGEGANGKTWLAKDLKRGNRVAIKSLKLTDDPKQLTLFIREAETLQSLTVAGVPKFYRSIIPENPIANPCYIVQEYISHPSLQKQLNERKQFSEAETLDVMLKLAELLKILETEYVPAIIHRDIKPSNILCDMSENAVNALYLIDFGGVANPQKKTGGSTIAGTFGYMAPEQLLGECTISSDYYALGATALHMLTGIPPYELDSDCFSLKYEEKLTEKAPELSQSMRALLKILLAPKQEDRPKDAQELIHFIHEVKSGRLPKIETRKKETLWDRLLYRIVNSKIAKAATQTKSWIETDGMIRYIGDEHIEYTFTTKTGELVGGAMKMKLPDRPLPAPCKVQYNPSNPMFNQMKKQF